MNLYFDFGVDNDSAKKDANDLITSRETYEQYLSAGILFPEEIRKAERIMHYLNKIVGASASSRPASEKLPA